jgi:probable dihydroxyacetone kinase regulator
MYQTKGVIKRMSKYTKQALGESLKKLLQKKPLNKITVTEIVADCELNRMTFYYHFRDIYDLLEWVCKEDAEKALKNTHFSSDWKEGLAHIYDLLLRNKAFVLHAYHSLSRDYIERYLYRITDALFVGLINEIDKDKRLDLKDKEFIASFYKFAFLGITLNWIENEMQDEPKDILKRLSILVEDNIPSAVDRFANC